MIKVKTEDVTKNKTTNNAKTKTKTKAIEDRDQDSDQEKYQDKKLCHYQDHLSSKTRLPRTQDKYRSMLKSFHFIHFFI